MKSNPVLPHIHSVEITREEATRVIDIALLILISLNVISVILETEQVLYEKYKSFFVWFDLFSVAIFTIEFILRLYFCTSNERYRHPVWGRIRYALSPMAIIDLIAILPFYLPLLSIDLRFVRSIRLFRIFRVLKIGRYSQSLMSLGNVIKSKREELQITLFSGIILLVVASSLMYYAERNVQPESFSSIPQAMWWGVVTLTTVGYGDVYPKTLIGKVLGAFIAILGIGLFALPAGIIASGFASEIHNENKEKVICPHCGKEIEV